MEHSRRNPNLTTLFLATVTTTIGLLVGAAFLNFFRQIISAFSDIPAPEGFGKNIILSGILAESVRGLVIVWLYVRHKGAGSSLKNAIVFGVMASLLAGSLWVILGYTTYGLSERFLFYETITILLQGVFSGIGLWIVFRKKA